MKKLLTLIITVTTMNMAFAQSGEWYSTSGWEMPFQFANVTTDIEGIRSNNIMRWAPVLNLNFYENHDFNESFGIFSGLTLRNVGFINEFNGDSIYFSSNTVRNKFRTYNLGIPLGVKLGNLDGFFFYGGFQVEYAFNYKEKTFVDGKREERFVVWFGDRAEQFPMSFFAGIQTKYGFNVKFQYYITNFHNKGYNDKVNGVKPYEGFDANVFYFSLNFAVFKNAELYYKEYE